jgi:hypothetical protein
MLDDLNLSAVVMAASDIKKRSEIYKLPELHFRPLSIFEHATNRLDGEKILKEQTVRTALSTTGEGDLRTSRPNNRSI